MLNIKRIKKELVQVISIDEDKCVNCHACISACPVKFCNDGSKNYVSINKDLCIACGSCIKACTHKARIGIDDFESFKNAIKANEKIIAIVAPAIAANFPNKYLQLNGYLKSLGVEGIFDVSFGAELAVMSYIEYIKNNSPKTVIAQPCPAIVTYIELYQPELLKYLAPVDSPMLHTIKMIEEFYGKYKKHKVVVISPCYAKAREFSETGLGNFNITHKSLSKHLKDNNIDLDDYQPVNYDNPPAERAVLFSSPGGLMRTAARYIPQISTQTRKIEGPKNLYEYFEKLPEMINQNKAPLLIDCLNCDMGCNGGPGTLNQEKSIDEIEKLIEERNLAMQKNYKKNGPFANYRTKLSIKKTLNRFWKKNIYNRTYLDLSPNSEIKTPNPAELKSIYELMLKYSEKDIYNCTACGYDACEGMAKAILNGLNKPQNCYHYQLAKINNVSQYQNNEVTKTTQALKTISEGNFNVILKTEQASADTLEIQNTFEQIYSAINIVTNSISQLINDSKQLIESIINGKLSARIDTSKHLGDFQKIAIGTNNLLNSIIAPLKTAVAYMDCISKGEIPEIITEEYKGEFDTIKNNINLLINSSLEIIQKSKQIADGNLTVSLKVRSDSDDLTKSLNTMITNIKNLIEKITESASLIANGTDEISSGSQQIAQGASQQAAAIEQVSSTMEQISATINQNAQNAEYSAKVSSSVAENMKEIKTSFEDSFEATNDILQKSGAINEIAEKINILAINAAIEAARAGEFGKGFNVVASEIRELSVHTQKAAQLITDLSQKSIKKLSQTNDLLRKIQPEVERGTQLSVEINAASQEQNTGIQQINLAISQFSDVTQQNTTSAEELATEAEQLYAQSQSLVDTVSFFKIKEEEEKHNNFNTEEIIKQISFLQSLLSNQKKEPEKIFTNKPTKIPNKGINLILDKDMYDNDFESFS